MTEKKTLFEKLSKKRERDSEVLMDWEYRGIWETAIKKYSGKAHFIYELLQNADDARATWVEFHLDKEGLWFKHNGSIRFSVSDVGTAKEDTLSGKLGHLNAITAIGNSNKIDEQKIGKFGIGFKAVFAYSHTPHIYDEHFNFKLQNFIVPYPIDPNLEKVKKGETVFYFPFNHPEKNADEAFKQIEEKLDNLFQPVLFLSNLKKITWQSVDKKGSYSKSAPIDFQNFGGIDGYLINVNNNSKKEKLWIFTTEILHAILKSKHKISVGFFLLDNKLETGFSYEAFCFFPTKEETNLGFLIQAPFLLTDNREGIKTDESWNNELIEQVANLAANSILFLKQLGIKEKTFLIDDTILDLIPYDESKFADRKDKISFKPFLTSIRDKFRTEQIIPGRNGKYFKLEKAFWASDPELAELFSDSQISELMECPNSGWVFLSKGQKQLNQANKQLESYISSIVKETLDPKKLLRRISSKFIEGQTDKWLIKFYSYLVGRKHLWDDKDKLALKRPILLNQDRKAVVPFNDLLTTPNIFLPAENHTSYDTIYKPLLVSEEALEFFKGLGLDKPDLKAEIYKTIIPQYNETFDFNDSEKLIEHLDAFLSYFENGTAIAQSDLIKSLTDINFIACRNKAKPATRWFALPKEVYFNSEKLKFYFSDCDNIYFLDEDFYIDYLTGNKKDAFYDFLKSLGVSNIPRLIITTEFASTENKERFGVEHHEVSNKYYQYQTTSDKNLEGIDEMVQNIDLSKSSILWDYLLILTQGKAISTLNYFFKGTYTFYPKGYSSNRSVFFLSSIACTLQYEGWLYDKNGNIQVAHTLTKETLNEAYNLEDPFADVLLEFLGIHNPDANLNLTDSQKQALSIGRKLIDEGVTQGELDEFINMIANRKRSNSDEKSTGEGTTVEEEDIDAMLSNLRKGIKKKRHLSEKEVSQGNEDISRKEQEKTDENDEPQSDQDDFSKPSVDLQKKINRLKEQTEAQIEDLTRIEKLNEIANNSEIYSYAWFKSLIELEYLNSSEANSQGKQFSIQFTKVEKEPDTERTLILKHPNRYIPQSIEDIGDIQIRIYLGDESHSVTVEVVSVKEYTLRAKLKKSVDISQIDLNKVNRVVIDIKNPVFILEELRKAFNSLKLDDDYNLRDNLTKNIRFIFGPPGTGKTTYLADKEIIPLMREDKELKILVLTPTNKAADVLTKRIIEKMGKDETYYNWLIRFGTTADAELENSTLVRDKTFDIRTKPRNTTITTIARFAYDYFQPDVHDERLHLKFLQWDYIVIDEASMINLAAIAYVLFQKPEVQFIIAGDPFQIQPITQIEQWKDLNIYSMVKLDKFVNPVTVPHQFEIVNLPKQFRSLPTIGCLFSHFTYDGNLLNHRKFEEQKVLKIDGLSFKDINIIKFPVSNYESIFKPNTLNKSNYQVYSALFTVEFIQRMAIQIEKTHKDKFKIGVICPYKAQATLIEKVFAQQHLEFEKVEILIGTIHGFQGDECDIIIAIFNPGVNISKSPNSFLNKQNILNVSISRARDYLFILMPDDRTKDIDNLYKIKRIERLVYKHAEKRHTVYDSEQIEEIMFGSKTYVNDNSFATSHQSVNVYSKPEKKYEVRCEEIAIDVQIKPIN